MDAFARVVGAAVLEVERAADLAAEVGRRVGTSDWLVVDQAMIDDFAAATGDRQWIHVDVARARREMPDGRTIAHGFLLLALLPRLAAAIVRVRRSSRAINYGTDRVRFIAPVPAGTRVRLHQVLKRLESVAGGVRLGWENTLEMEGTARPALVAETLTLIYD
jgi:acyl dehydratase